MFHRLLRTLDLYDGLRLPVKVGRLELLLIHEEGETRLMQQADTALYSILELICVTSSLITFKMC